VCCSEYPKSGQDWWRASWLTWQAWLWQSASLTFCGLQLIYQLNKSRNPRILAPNSLEILFTLICSSNSN
jgi:hypothetical protein